MGGLNITDMSAVSEVGLAVLILHKSKLSSEGLTSSRPHSKYFMRSESRQSDIKYCDIEATPHTHMHICTRHTNTEVRAILGYRNNTFKKFILAVIFLSLCLMN